MKKILFLLISIVSSLYFATSALAIQGDGSEESPFLITNQVDLELINDFPDCYFKLMNDISLEGDFVPLCLYTGGFSGEFDGNGKSISNLTVKGGYNYAGLFAQNSGIIKNVSVYLSEEGISVERVGNSSVGGIAGYNNGTINRVSVCGKIKCSNTSPYSYDDSCGGIAGYGDSNSVIMDSYFIGEIDGDSYEGGIIGKGGGSTTNCYAAATYVGRGKSRYPIAGAGSLTYCFYDKTISGIQGYNYEKTTAAMQIKKTYVDAGWDFEDVWAIDAIHNSGYPYLKWEARDDKVLDYSISSVSIKSQNYKELELIPENENFYVEIAVMKNTDRMDKDTLVIAKYDKDNALTGITYMKSFYEKSHEVIFGTLIENNGVSHLKVFIWNDFSNITPLSNVVGI